MGHFFTCVVTQGKKILFCEYTEHEAIKGRCKLPDGRFVCVEDTVTWGYVIEEDPIPGWYKRIHEEMRRDVEGLARTIWPIRREFLKTDGPAYNAFVDQYDVAQGKLLNARGALMAKYVSDREGYRRAIEPVMMDFASVVSRLYVDYDLEINQALGRYIRKLSRIEGYVPVGGAKSVQKGE